MPKTRARAYTSPTLVLLCFDWPDGGRHADFLGFSIKRSPGFGRTGAPQYLFNKLDFTPPGKGDKPKTSDKAPIQKFNWWDGGIGPSDSGKTFTYTITPVLGTGPGDLQEQTAEAVDLKVRLPAIVEGGIGSYFNRAVVSSQAFLAVAEKPLKTQMSWLANGIENAVPGFLAAHAGQVAGAIYHLTDTWKIVPALQKYPGRLSFSYFLKKDDDASQPAAEQLASSLRSFSPRSRIASLMHDKFIVGFVAGQPRRLLMGSMNFTPEAQTVQANLLHTFESSQMAALYADRHALLLADPSTADTARGTELAPGSVWKAITDVPGSRIRVFFSPEKAKSRVSIDTIVAAVRAAKSSVVFALFSPTDKLLLDTLLDAGDQGKIMLGLLNSIGNPEARPREPGKPLTEAQQVAVTVYNRSRKDRKVIPFDAFSRNAPASFLPELRTIDTSSFSTRPPAGSIPPVHVHHKFVVIDADTARPTIYTGSQNLSVNSVSRNDENLLEIKGNTALAAVYFAEFMRLYNHYRARAVWESVHGPKARPAGQDPLVLAVTRDGWVKGAYTKGTPEYAARTRLA